ncbi:hypothetical protein E2C01_004685 [Portunus trituberculatus]|uniref:Uncharacterized protein n=1 Tax=Portunus trituberculatus TaxID=210409 RepID=A0A5B7CSC6_PORTR|nr:hypothetical protein [Portunus trituberculatus]
MAAQITVTAGVTHSTLNTSTASSHTTIAGRPLSHSHHAALLSLLLLAPPPRSCGAELHDDATPSRPSHGPSPLFPTVLTHVDISGGPTRTSEADDKISGSDTSLLMTIFPDFPPSLFPA